MKKGFALVIVLVLVTSFFALTAGEVSALSKIIATPDPELWEWYGEGVTGEEIPMFNITTTPHEWLTLKANGIKVDGPTQICRPFKAGRFGWTGEIYQLVDGAWVKLPTTNGWVPDGEGSYMACAKAPAAGTYALFGFYVKPAVVVEEPEPEPL